MKRYRELFQIPNVWVLIIASFPARIAYGMIGLSIFFKTEQATGSVALAGLAIGLNSMAGSLTAGIRGSVMDRYGQKWPLGILVPSYAAMLIALSFAQSKTMILLLSLLLGLCAPPINLSVRPLWKIVVPENFLRTAYALDTAVMSATHVIGPIIATTLALSSLREYPLRIAALLMLIGGGSLGLSKVSRSWIPEKKNGKADSIYRNLAMQILMIEGCFIGFGWGVFDVAVPAFATLEGVAHRTAWILAAMGIFNIVGGLLAGLVSKKTSPLKAMKTTYAVWLAVTLPLAFTKPDWTLIICGGLLGLVGGALQVFYWEVLERVRPQGSAMASLGWLWTVEGSFMALGAASGGFISEKLSPEIALGTTTLCVAFGAAVLVAGRRRLINADHIPSDEEDLKAMEDNSDRNK